MQINLKTVWNNTSYGVVAINLIKSLLKSGCDITLFPIGHPEFVSQLDLEIYKSILLNNDSKFDINAPCITLFHQFALLDRVGRGKHIGFPIFELDEFNNVELINLKNVDKILVCSSWAKNIINKYIDTQISIVPLGVNDDIFYPHNTISSESTIFLHIGKFEKRKNIDKIVSAFCEAFKPTDNVILKLSCFNRFLNQQQHNDWINLCKCNTMSGKIEIIPWLPTQIDVCNLINMSDCGLYVSSAEGFCLPLLETMACGKTAIVTDYSGHTEFCNKDNAKLITVDELEIANDNMWFKSGIGRWAKFGDNQFNQLVKHMQEVHQLKQNGQLKLNKAGISTAEKFTWTNSAQKLVEALT